jgi:signal transduction histidine kinase
MSIYRRLSLKGVAVFAALALGAFVAWAVLDHIGPVFHTALVACWESGSSVTNYAAKAMPSLLHQTVRAIVSALLMKKWGAKLKNCKMCVLRFLIALGVFITLDFASYAVRFLAIAFWNALTSGLDNIHLMNVIQTEYIDKIDVLARIGQAFFATNAWYFVQKIIDLHERHQAEEAAEEERRQQRREERRQWQLQQAEEDRRWREQRERENRKRWQQITAAIEVREDPATRRVRRPQ